MKSKPTSVTLLALFVLMFSGWHFFRLIAAVESWSLLSRLQLPISPLYYPITGAGWGVAGLLLAIALWRGWQQSSTQFKYGSWLYSIFFWLEHSLLVIAETGRNNTVFAFIINLLVISSVYLILARPDVQNYLGVKNE